MQSRSAVQADSSFRDLARSLLARQERREAKADLLGGMRRALVDEALAQSANNQSAAARLLGVERKVIAREMEKLKEEERGEDGVQ